MIHELKISFSEIDCYAHTNLAALAENPKGIILSFHGLNGGVQMDDALSKWDSQLAEQGILSLAPYYGPWS